ncbi:hypothetical protein GIB67_041334 [Kingdonia uniflora]|uniref:Amino acid transporter transmembrane domain-containing protein n=1 Tax=Kingdonia uniflora TaxID=39325 RepID=A0A7J7NIN4_9MAGN|nr:hypothetical protein GIB67_041334 [Kingdonia uniflora]
MDAGEDGHIRTGTVWTATAHAITSIIGSGVLTLPWSVAQLGWIIGPIILFFFACVTYYTAILLSDCYRSPDLVNGRRNYTYIDAVRVCLGAKDVVLCGIVQYGVLWGSIIGYTIATAISMAALKRSICFHKNGHDATCEVSGNLYMIIYGAMEIVLSQCPSLEKVTWLSYIAATTSFAYSLIAAFLCVVKFATNHEFKGTLMGAKMGHGVSPPLRTWHAFQALGNIAFAYTYSQLLIEIQDTLKSPPPENKTMKKATSYSIGATTIFYVTLGCMGYVAFGNDAPGNILTGFYEPFWLIAIANLSVTIHLVGAYQVFAQPIYAVYEKVLASKWPTSSFLTKVYTIKFPCTNPWNFKFTLCTLVLRTMFVILTTLISMMFPFFNAVVGLLGSLAFWPLTVYYPVRMYMVQTKVERRSRKWMGLQILSMLCFVATLLSGIGSVADVIGSFKHAKLFHIEL